jgi:two-component system nitrogen regulation sensor histidine kinase GlnL
MGFYVLSRNPRNIKNITYFLFCFACAVWSYAYLFWQNSMTYEQALFYSRGLMFGAIFIPVFFLHHVFTILGIEKNNSRILRLCYGFTFLSAAFAFHPHFVKNVAHKLAFRFWPEPGYLFHPFLVIWMSIAVYTMWHIYRGFRSSSGMLKNQMKYLFVASVVGWCGGATNFFLWYDIPIPPLGNITVSVYVALFAYVIVRFRLMEVRLAMTLTSIFFVVYGLIIGVPAVLVLKARPWLITHLGVHWWLLPLTIYTILLAAAPFIYTLLQRKAEARLLRERRHYQQTLLQASRGMTLIKDLDHLQKLIVHILTRTIRIKHASIYLFNKETLQYDCCVRRSFAPLRSAKSYAHDSLLIQYLARTRTPLVVEEVLYRELRGEGPEFKRLRHILRSLDADVIIPSFVHDNLLGFLMLGQKVSQEVFTPDDLDVLATLANQVALAIENCHFITELEMTQAQLFQASKMADLGTMASGIGHQINNRLNAIMLATEHGLLKDLAWIRTCIRDGKFDDACQQPRSNTEKGH